MTSPTMRDNFMWRAAGRGGGELRMAENSGG